ncbi:hypothetical protein [Lusitaniella coriacea]|uniref:hypothetical protein n=1 Tax=Lusitaniella coriacea TaxID=1983105 RepID=UPI003CED3DE6
MCRDPRRDVWAECREFGQMAGDRAIAILSLLFAAVASTIAIGLFAPPAAAQFFQSAEDWMSQQFPDAADVVPVVFNVLRGLFVLYVGIALVKVINAMRDDEDWKSLARTPLIILIAVTLGDVLVVLIIGQ